MPTWLLAGWWGLVAGAALLIGAAAGYLAAVPRRIVGLIMGFGAGVLISALAFELTEESFHRGGTLSVAVGLAAVVTLVLGFTDIATRFGDLATFAGLG